MYLPMKFHDDALQGQEQVFYVVTLDSDPRDIYARLVDALLVAENLLMTHGGQVQLYKVVAYADCLAVA